MASAYPALGAGHSPLPARPDKVFPAGVNPSHLMNLFTYEKGYCFVYYLSQLCGDPQRFDGFLRVSRRDLPPPA